MSATADSSCGELSEALQRNAKHEARLSNISGHCCGRTLQETILRLKAWRSLMRELVSFEMALDRRIRTTSEIQSRTS
jgi:hypothetical protein